MKGTKKQVNKQLLDELCYRVGYWDKMQFERFALKDSTLEESLELGKQKIYSFPQLAMEIYHRFSSAEDSLFTPEEGGTMIPPEKVKPEAQWAKEIHDELSANERFVELQDEVQGRSFLALLAANVFIEELAKRLAEPPAPLQDPGELRRQVIPLIQKPKPERTEEEQELIDQITAQGIAAVEAIKEWAEEMVILGGPGEGWEDRKDWANWDVKQEEDESPLGAVIAVIADIAAKQVEEVEEMFLALGGGLEGGTEGEIGSVEELQKLSKQFSRNSALKKILRHAGRLKKIAAKKQKSKTRASKQKTICLEQGDTIPDVVASEMAQLHTSHRAQRKMFKKNLAEANLTQYKKGGREEQGRGPLIVLDDNSESMQGTPNIEAKALCLAMLGVAQKQRRHYRLIQFDSGFQPIKRVDDFSPKEKDPAKILQAMKHFSNGGTKFMEPLNNAVKCIKEHSTYKNADIVMVTDGDANIWDDWAEDFKKVQAELGFEIYAVILGRETDLNLKKIIKPENIIRVSSIARDEEKISTILGI